MYDTYGDGIQIKAGDCLLRMFNIGDKSDLPDGVYVAPDGIVVIVKGIFVATFTHLISKWGDRIDIEDIVGKMNPLAKIVTALNTSKGEE